MKKQLLAFLITFGVMIAGTASASLWSYYNEQGLNLPSIEERAVEWSNISSEQYTGSKTQNLALESYLRGDYDYILGATPTPTSSAPVKYVETPDFYAYSPAVAGDTTITLNDLQDIYGNTLTMADFGDIGYGRIDPDGAEVSESFTFSGVTANSDGTYTLTGVKTVLAKYPYTQTSGLVRSHSINAIVRFTNTAAFYDNFANKENDEIIDGTWTYNVFPGVSSTVAQATNNNEFVTLYQLQQATSTGGVEASETVKGVGEFATQAEMVAGTATGGTGANLFVWNNYVSSTSATGTIPATPLTSQYLDKSFLEVDTTSTLEFNGNVLGVQATSTPTASKIPIADGSNKLDEGWLQMTDAQATDLTDAGSTTLHFHKSNCEVISLTRDNTTANGTVSYSHTLGELPTRMWWYGINTVKGEASGGQEITCNGYWDGTNTKNLYDSEVSGIGVATNFCYLGYEITGSRNITATLNSVSTSSISLAWTKSVDSTAGSGYLIVNICADK